MAATLYQRDLYPILHRGAIFQYRPIFWLDPPLWILRHQRWTPPRSAGIYAPSELHDAFRRGIEDNQEDVVARAKVRYIVILSNDVEARKSQFKELIVAPIYTVDPQVHRPDFLEALRQGRYPDLFYLPPDPAFPQMVESYVDFRKVQALSKGFLTEGKLDVCFSSPAIKAILYRYREYLCRDAAPLP